MKSEGLFQVSTLSEFQNKGYDGESLVETMLAYGDTGFGTFHALNGEMIILDGCVYRALGDCSVELAESHETTPFAALGFLIDDTVHEIKVNGDMTKLMNQLDKHIGLLEAPVLAELSGTFDKLILHSARPQQKPYQELDVIVGEQPIFVWENIPGSLVGIRCPKSALGKNVVGWHFHFISKDRRIGGHVNDLLTEKLLVRFDVKKNILVIKNK